MARHMLTFQFQQGSFHVALNWPIRLNILDLAKAAYELEDYTISTVLEWAFNALENMNQVAQAIAILYQVRTCFACFLYIGGVTLCELGGFRHCCAGRIGVSDRSLDV
jgi:hypothetical protein